MTAPGGTGKRNAATVDRRHSSLLIKEAGHAGQFLTLQEFQGGPAAGRQELRDYHQALYEGYAEAFGSRRNAMLRMKEVWFYLIHLFDGADALEKPLRKAREGWEYETVVNQIFACWPK